MLMSAKSKKIIVVCCVCLYFLTIGSRDLFACDKKVSAPKGQCHWATEAEKLVGQLDSLASKAQKVEMPMPCLTKMSLKEQYKARLRVAKANSFTNRRTVERILWRLWLITGKPPHMQKTDEIPHAFLLRNAEAYRQYVTKHATLTQEAVYRLGLNNAVDSIGSPLWYMTIKYLTKTASFPQDWMIDIRTTPTHTIVEFPLSENDYDRMSVALTNWLKANKERMVWDSRAKRFRPQDGEYSATGKLWEAIVLPQLDIEHLKKGKASRAFLKRQRVN